MVCGYCKNFCYPDAGSVGFCKKNKNNKGDYLTIYGGEPACVFYYEPDLSRMPQEVQMMGMLGGAQAEDSNISCGGCEQQEYDDEEEDYICEGIEDSLHADIYDKEDSFPLDVIVREYGEELDLDEEDEPCDEDEDENEYPDDDCNVMATFSYQKIN